MKCCSSGHEAVCPAQDPEFFGLHLWPSEQKLLILAGYRMGCFQCYSTSWGCARILWELAASDCTFVVLPNQGFVSLSWGTSVHQFHRPFQYRDQDLGFCNCDDFLGQECRHGIAQKEARSLSGVEALRSTEKVGT